MKYFSTKVNFTLLHFLTDFYCMYICMYVSTYVYMLQIILPLPVAMSICSVKYEISSVHVGRQAAIVE
jgi:glucose uptake protein GlcU